jgi:DNA-binding helix-hairpin-helix protein with protein kinase domain
MTVRTTIKRCSWQRDCNGSLLASSYNRTKKYCRTLVNLIKLIAAFFRQMIFRGVNNEQYVTGGELGRGGEGTVYALQSHSGLVLKKYNKPLSEEKICKLHRMVAIRSAAIETYSAWPADVVRDEQGTAWGFVMKKLTGFAPLHKLFSPMDRKNLFPDKGYNFLAHVARNLATAFYKLHEAGLIVGDVNEGNILVNHNGLIAFIDCDSFQVTDGKRYFFCEVGVPRYTPPELLKKGSFEKVIRTVNTDSFSLAVLIFQLLFLGRHPFAGKNKSSTDYDEETAIRHKQFAYSLESQKKKLSPPPDSFDINNLPEALVRLFHLAFEQDSRPEPALWIKAIDEMLRELSTCYESRLHVYPSKLSECPWCAFKRTRGIMFFADNSFVHNTIKVEDIDAFVQGFDVKAYEVKKWSGNLVHAGLTATPIDRKFYKYKLLRWYMMIGIPALWICLCYLFSAVYLSALVIILPVIIYRHSPWTRKINDERSKRIDLLHSLKPQLNKLINDYNNPPELPAYQNKVSHLSKLALDYKNIPNEFARLKRIMEEKIYNEQLHNYLSRFEIKDHEIPAFGSGKKTSLYNNGIYNAADVTKINRMKIAGIGPKNKQIVIEWQQQLSSKFVYIPDPHRIAVHMESVKKDVAILQQQLESAIRKEYQSVNYLKQHLSNRVNYVDRQISDLSLRVAQAELDIIAFQKFSK